MKTKTLTLNAMFIAITLVLALVPNIGMINFGPVAITIMHIPVIVAGIVLGFQSSMINAFAFGVASLFIAATRGSGLFDPLFVNPLVSVLPRLIFGLAISGTYNVMKKVSKNFIINASVTAAVSSLIHTVAVLGALYFAIIGSSNTEILNAAPSSVFVLIGGVLASNGILEIIASVVIGVPVAAVLNRIHRA